MADIELELLSRAIMTGGIDQLISAQIEARHFFDPVARSVFETCADHYSVWRNSLSLDGVKRHHPDYRVISATDDLGYLIKMFREDRGVKFGITKAMDINLMLEEAESYDTPPERRKEIRSRLPELFMEHAREVAAFLPGEQVSRFSDMGNRVRTIREQQRTGVLPGVPTGIPGVDPYVRAIKPGDFFVHAGYSGRGKTQSLVRSSVQAYAAGDVVLMNSLEMSPDEIWEIYDAEATKLSRRAIQFRDLSEQDYERYEQAAARVRAAQNDIVYVRVETVDKLAAMVERYGANTVCVDYISLMEGQLRAQSEWERTKQVSQALKRMAGHMDVRVYAAAQSNRDAALEGPTENNIAGYVGIFQDSNVINQVQGRLIKNRNMDKGPPGKSGYYEFYEHCDRDRMIFEPWTSMHEWQAAIKTSNGA
jgi:KaiC/GvpD/RAD55 family RecA-like ATPase